MRAGDKQMLDRIVLIRLGAFDALSAAALGPVYARRRTLNVALMRNRDDHCFFFDQVLDIYLANFFVTELRAAGVTVLAGDLFAIIANHAIDSGLVTEDAQE